MALAKDYDSVMARSNDIMKRHWDWTTTSLNPVPSHSITKH